MTIARARQLLGSKYQHKTDKEIQAVIDRLKPLVQACARQVIDKFDLDKCEKLNHTDCRVQKSIGSFNGLPVSEPDGSELSGRPLILGG